MRRRSGVSRPRAAKPSTCTERYDVDPTGISMKVARITLGDLPSCLVLLASRGDGMGWQKSADAVVAAENRSGEGLNLSRVASHACSLSGQDRSLGATQGPVSGEL